jgi:Tfp pilus assembly protein PilN
MIMADSKSSILKKEISFGKKAKYPTKKSMNFIRNEVAVQNRHAIEAFIVFLVLLAFFVRFAVLLPIQKVNEKQAEYESKEQTLQELKDKTKSYSDVKKACDDKIGSFLTDDERLCLDRPDMLTMMEEDILPSISIQSISITGDQLTVVTGTTTLDVVSSVLNTLQQDSRNSYATVTTAAASDQDTVHVIANYTIHFASEAAQAGRSSDSSGNGSTDSGSGKSGSGSSGSSDSSSTTTEGGTN